MGVEGDKSLLKGNRGVLVRAVGVFLAFLRASIASLTQPGPLRAYSSALFPLRPFASFSVRRPEASVPSVALPTRLG